MSARDLILARLRANRPAPLPAPTLTEPAGPPDRQHFIGQLEAAHAQVMVCDDWRATLRTLCKAHRIERLMLPNRPGWLMPWEGGPALRLFDAPIETLKQALFNAFDAGLTVADCAIADTGTLVLSASGVQPRTLSLVPPIHICLLDPRKLYANLPAALRGEIWSRAMPTNLLFISGPSKTADIQQTLAYGAHGPKTLIVLLTEEASR